MAQKLENIPLRIDYGHSTTHIVIKFNRSVEHVLLTPEQAQSMIDGITNAARMLEDFHAGKTPGVAATND